MASLTDANATFKTSFKLRLGSVIKNLTENIEMVVWYGVKETRLKFSPCPEFSEILKKYAGSF